MNRVITSFAVLLVGAGSALACGGEYTVRANESLSHIADRLYKNAGAWHIIHKSNRGRIGDDPSAIYAGMKLRLPCVDGLPDIAADARRKPAPVAAVKPKPRKQVQRVTAQRPVARPADEPTNTVSRVAALPLIAASPNVIRVVTGDDFRPFTDRGIQNGGMLTEVLHAAMDSAVGERAYETFWQRDWQVNLEPMVDSNAVEVAFPYAKPDCAGNPTNTLCQNYHFSEPMFEFLVQLFVDTKRPIAFLSDSDIEGRTLCRPAALPTHMLDEQGRNWLRDGKITLIQPALVSDCFFALVSGDVDAVVLNEFTGRETVRAMGLEDRVAALPTRPLAISGLHAIIPKRHPQADALLETVNTGLQSIREDGAYRDIVARHMKEIWGQF
jgi:polar amino acid transport system substrate-binding protein